ncbi:hypothetical protein EI546_05990 [Aequorivita sp. H23M31]|uniref:Glycosyltransferase family 1 protein n=1 Tax=Aequorivita ciconiae TaxID=2494375 RepID=A0A410G210_9FLAO|nr:hypothetical protein EI546_05990 [Aequorivita sp. H23M31]
MPKPSIIHIHTDLKFIHSVESSDEEEFENTLILVGNKGKYDGIYKDSIRYYDYSLKGFRKIISLCKTANIVILYSLDFPKAYIANRLPKSITVIWRFFGTELYSRIPEQVHSEKTIEILRLEEERNLYLKLKRQLRSHLSVIKYRSHAKNEINRAIFKRSDFFLGLAEPEHKFLKTIWQDLPPFLQSNIPPYLEVNTSKRTITNLIILGNNRRPYNNHLDIIEGIIERNSENRFKFLLMFNYGSKSAYSDIVKKKASQVKEIEILENFMSLKKFQELYTTADAFVLNGHRQMAMGNVLEALKQNIKIYLNEKNLMYSWLKENEFHVFTIEDFFSDLESNNIALSHPDALFNQQQLVKLTAKHNKQVFQNSIKKILKDGR